MAHSGGEDRVGGEEERAGIYMQNKLVSYLNNNKKGREREKKKWLTH